MVLSLAHTMNDMTFGKFLDTSWIWLIQSDIFSYRYSNSEADRKKFDVLMMANIGTTVLWDETPSGLVAGFQHLSRTCCLFEGKTKQVPPKYGSSTTKLHGAIACKSVILIHC